MSWHNKSYTASVESAYRQLTKDTDLELIFSIRHLSKVNEDSTVRFKGKVCQLLPFKGDKVDILMKRESFKEEKMNRGKRWSLPPHYP